MGIFGRSFSRIQSSFSPSDVADFPNPDRIVAKRPETPVEAATPGSYFASASPGASIRGASLHTPSQPTKMSTLARTFSSVRESSRFRKTHVQKRSEGVETKVVPGLQLDRIASIHVSSVLRDPRRSGSIASPSKLATFQQSMFEGTENVRLLSSPAAMISDGELQDEMIQDEQKSPRRNDRDRRPVKKWAREGDSLHQKKHRRTLSLIGRTMSMTRLHSRTKFERTPSHRAEPGQSGDKVEQEHRSTPGPATPLVGTERNEKAKDIKAGSIERKRATVAAKNVRPDNDRRQKVQPRPSELYSFKDGAKASMNNKRPRGRNPMLDRSLSHSSPSVKEPVGGLRSSWSFHRLHSNTSSVGPSPKSSPIFQRLRSLRRFSRSQSAVSTPTTPGKGFERGGSLNGTDTQTANLGGRDSSHKIPDSGQVSKECSPKGAVNNQYVQDAIWKASGTTQDSLKIEGDDDSTVTKGKLENCIELSFGEADNTNVDSGELGFLAAKDLSELLARSKILGGTDAEYRASDTDNASYTPSIADRSRETFNSLLEDRSREDVFIMQEHHAGRRSGERDGVGAMKSSFRPPPLSIQKGVNRPPPMILGENQKKPPPIGLVIAGNRPPSLSMSEALESAEDEEDITFGSTGDFTGGGFRITARGMVDIQKRVTRRDSDNYSFDDSCPPSSKLVIVRDLTEFHKGRSLGAGVSGRVYLAKHAPTGKLMAMKVVNVYDEGKRNQLLKELETLTTHVSRFLVRFYGAFYDGSGAVHIALEYMDRGCLSSTIQKSGPIPEAIVRMIAYDCLRGLRFLHRYRVIHRDFKTANILLSRRLCRAKLADFGLARDVNPEVSLVDTFVGTMAYMSPERLTGGKYTYASDIWALGVSVAECLLGKYPFDRPTTYFDYIASTTTENMLSGRGRKFSRHVRHFVKVCTDVDPSRRPTAQELMDHPWITAKPRDSKLFGKWLDEVAKPAKIRRKQSNRNKNI